MKFILLMFFIFFNTWVMADLLPPNDLIDNATIVRNGTIVTLENADTCVWFDATRYQLIPETKTNLKTFLAASLLTSKPCGYVPSWVVAKNKSYPTRPLYKLIPNNALVTTGSQTDGSWSAIGRIKVGTLCEEQTIKLSTGTNQWRYTTNKEGIRGLAVCEVSR